MTGKKLKPPDVTIFPCGVPPKPTSFWNVDREMLRFKIHFFLFIGALSAAIPFLVVFAKERLGLSPSSLGAVLTAQMFLFVFTKPLIGYIADYFNRLKSIIVVLTLITGSCYFFLLAIPKFEQEPPVTSFQDMLLDEMLCQQYENVLKFKDIGESTGDTDINFLVIENGTESCQLCSHIMNCSFIATNQSFFETHKIVNDSYDYRQQELNINNKRIFSVTSNKNDSITVRFCSCAGSFSTKNDSSECTNFFCSNELNIAEIRDYLKNSSMRLSKLLQNLTEIFDNISERADYLKNTSAFISKQTQNITEILDNISERGDNLKNISALFFQLSQKLKEVVNTCNHRNASTNFDSSTLFCKLSELLNNSGERGDYLKSTSRLFFQLSQSLAEMLSTCNLQKASTNFETEVKISKVKNISDFQTIQFWVFAFLFSLSSICANATFTLSDTACCESIQKTGADFGKQRMWGSVGWGLIAPIAGYLNDFTGDFLQSWILMAVMLLLFLWNLSKLDLVKPNFSSNILGDVGTVFKSKEFLAYELVIFMNGISTGMIWFYLIWFLTSIGGSELLCGLCIAVQCFCGAIPFMFFSGWVIRKVGCFQILSAALLTYVVRFLWYSYLYNPWWVLPVECCHGITYGLYYTVLAHYGKKSSKPGTEATTQSVLFSTHEGLGAGLGCVLAGLGFDYFGGHETFFAASMFCGCGFLISLVLFATIVRQRTTTDDSQPQV